METHVYLNGKHYEQTLAPRRQVIALMRKIFGATLLRERLVAGSDNPRKHREMHFATQRLLQLARRARSGIEERG